MRVSVEGNLRRRSRSGIGPFRRERWLDEPFRWEQIAGPNIPEQATQVLDSFHIGCLSKDDRVFIQASIRGRLYILGEAKYNVDSAYSFSVLSVAGMEINGRITCATQSAP